MCFYFDLYYAYVNIRKFILQVFYHLLTVWRIFDTIKSTFPCSSMVEQEAVNFEVVSSSLTGGAIFLA